MKFKNYLFFTLLLVTIIILSACKDEESVVTKYSAEEADSYMQSMSNDISNDLYKIMNSEGLTKTTDAIRNIELNFDLSLITDYIKSQDVNKLLIGTSELSKTLVSKLPANNKLLKPKGGDLFESLWGVYLFNSSTNSFELTSNASDIKYIQLKFPADGAESNNATLTINELSVYTYLEGGSDFFNHFEAIESISANLIIDDVLVSSIELSIDYNQEEPVGVDLSLFLKPYTLNITTISNEKSVINTMNFIDIASQIAGYEMKATYDKQLSDEEKTMLSVEGMLYYRNISTAGKINTQMLMDKDNLTVEVLKESVNLEIYHTTNLMGTVIFDKDGSQDIQAYIKFLDGSKKPLSDYFKGLELPLLP